MKMKKIPIENLSEEYKRLLISRLAKLGVVHENLEKMSMERLEIVYAEVLSKQTRTVFMGELCHNCGFIWHRKFAYDHCPRCGK